MTTTKTTTKTATAPTMGRNATGAYVATIVMDAASKVLKTWNPKRHQGITQEQALEAMRQIFGYVSPNAWSYDTAHPTFGVRNVGRPRPAQKVATSTARPGRGTATKTVTKTATKTTPVKGAPKSTAAKSPAPTTRTRATKTTPVKGATPATVARSASRSRTTKPATPVSTAPATV